VTAPRRAFVAVLSVLSMGLLMGQQCSGGATETSGEDPDVATSAAPPVEVPTDGDGDDVTSFCDNCLDVPNRDQRETEADADGIGNVCDCDFNNDGFCNSDDANLFLADYQAGVDPAPALGTDMNGDGVVDEADFALFEPLYAANAPGAARTEPPEMILNGAVPGPCWDYRVNLGGDGSSDGCSVPASQVPGLELLGLPPGGDLNNPTDAKTRERTGGLVGCPNAAFATFRKPGDVCGIDVPVEICTAARAGLPCFPGYCKGPESIECGSCPAGTRCYAGGSRCNPDPPVACSTDSDCTDVFGTGYACEGDVRCGDLSQPRACEKHDACGAVCGYRTYACNDQFLLDMVATCNALEGLERQYCHTDCLLFANAYYESVALADGQIFRDDGTWLDIDYADEAGDCACCDAGTPPAVCGDGVCEPPVESCRAPDCPEDCGACELGDACLQDEDCPGLACLPDGRCGRLPSGSECSESGQCRSGLCIATCQSRCGDGFCDGLEVCGSASPFSCFSDCGTCELGQSCTADGDCASTDTCLFGTCSPKLPDGSPCESDNDCQNGDCELLSCGGVKCLTDADCSGLGAELCVATFCLPAKLPNGQPCIRNAMCQSGVCNAGLCAEAGSVELGGLCTNDDACASGACAGVCVCDDDGDCPGSQVCLAAICIEPQFCGDLSCNNGETCATCGIDCGVCPFCGDLSCNNGETCSTCAFDCGACCASNGSICAFNGDCCSGRCDGFECLACTNGSCNEDSDCCGSQTCNNKNIFGVGDCS
jgi:hypothetical protein